MLKQTLLLVLCVHLSASANQFYNFFKKHSREEVYSGLYSRYKIDYNEKLMNNENYI